jgi:hypothetical protein
MDSPNPASPNNPDHPPKTSPEQQQANAFQDLHYHYKRRYRGQWFGNIFWGLLVVIIGVMFLARSLGFVPGLSVGQFFAHFWPLFIVIAGLSVMADGGIVARVISMILMLLILVVFVLWLFHIPVPVTVGHKVYNFDPAVMDNWLNGHR